MTRGSATLQTRRITMKQKPKSRAATAKSTPKPRSSGKTRPSSRTRVRVVQSQATRAKRPARPLPPADPLGERPFLTSLDRSLREYRTLWEALAKR